MFTQIPRAAGDERPLVRVKRYNRTGGALIRGKVVMEDWSLGDAATTSTELGNGASPTENVVSVATAGLKTFPMLVCDEDSLADDAQGWFIAYGPCLAAIVDDDVGSADVDKGDPLTVTNGATYAVEAGAGERIVGTAWADAAASSDSSSTQVDASSHLRKVFWTGGMPNTGTL